MALEYDKELRFTCAVRSFHYYRDIWDPSSYESMRCYHERNNPFDRFSIKVVQFASDKVAAPFYGDFESFKDFARPWHRS